MFILITLDELYTHIHVARICVHVASITHSVVALDTSTHRYPCCRTDRRSAYSVESVFANVTCDYLYMVVKMQIDAVVHYSSR